ncbi:hypothetical protein A3SI_15743 [Nitritalea halalkaliphila LW7]|uniref:Uncharacterized protein n=1 Tax=Nitritalea halalkaliphila LW7 TaxID=1189621 RepID=I5BYC5_9BACT|nr:hypothetical protein [Nitritalea halalkaliphila]EIM74577.1 hypothetical protein A3SI_15743 [Nitritalea halalkaliphila LW7]
MPFCARRATWKSPRCLLFHLRSAPSLRGERPAELEEEGDADQGEVADWEGMLAADDAAFLHSVYEGGLDAFEDLDALDASEEDPNPFLGRPLDRGPQDPRSFASFCGLDLAAFPDDRLMTEAQVSTLVEKMAALFSYYNLEPIFRRASPSAEELWAAAALLEDSAADYDVWDLVSRPVFGR